MKMWQKSVVLLLAAALPLAIFGYHAYDVDAGAKQHKQAKVKKPMPFDEVMLTKSSELAEINLRIATVRGELLKFEANRRELIGEVAAMRDKLTHMVEIESKDMPSPSNDSPSEPAR